MNRISTYFVHFKWRTGGLFGSEWQGYNIFQSKNILTDWPRVTSELEKELSLKYQTPVNIIFTQLNKIDEVELQDLNNVKPPGHK